MNSRIRRYIPYASVSERHERLLPGKVGRVAMASFFLFGTVFAAASITYAQQANSTSVSGTVTDPSGAVIPNATVTIENPVSDFTRSTTTDGAGSFTIPNVPFNPYHLTVTATGFGPYKQDVEVRSSVPVELKIALKISTSATTVTVTGDEAVVQVRNVHAVLESLHDALPS